MTKQIVSRFFALSLIIFFFLGVSCLVLRCLVAACGRLRNVRLMLKSNSNISICRENFLYICDYFMIMRNCALCILY